MCEALRELMKDEIERDVNEAKEKAMREGRAEGRAEEGNRIVLNMSKKGISIEDIASMTGKDIEDVKSILQGKMQVTV